MKRMVFLASIIASIFVINNLIQSIYGLWNKQELLIRAEKNLEKKKKENQEIKKQLIVAHSKEFIEKEARDRLFMVKSGESQVIIPQDLFKASSSANARVENIPNWKKWLDLFF